MTTVSLVYFGLLLATLMTAAAWLYFSFEIHKAKPKELSWRGIIKLVSLNTLPQSLSVVYPRWLRGLLAFYITACLWVAYTVWGGDHSFLVVLFPLLFYYFFLRFFFWEKADLTD